MIHYYYRSKEELFQSVVETTYERTLADLEKALAPNAAFGERVARLYTKLGSLSDEERETVRMVVREAMTSPNVLQALLERSCADTFRCCCVWWRMGSARERSAAT